jgi:hypothetical protein
MFRFDGEVFLLGTAIAAPSTHDINKNGDDLRLISAGLPPRRRLIVANRGSYSG